MDLAQRPPYGFQVGLRADLWGHFRKELSTQPLKSRGAGRPLTCHSTSLCPPRPVAQVYFWGRNLGFETIPAVTGRQSGRQALTPSDFLSGKMHVAPPAVKLQ